MRCKTDGTDGKENPTKRWALARSHEKGGEGGKKGVGKKIKRCQGRRGVLWLERVRVGEQGEQWIVVADLKSQEENELTKKKKREE